MKIDESCINHNALREIDKAIEDVYDLTSEDRDDNIRIATIGQIRGIIDFATLLKDVLREI